MKQRPSTYGAIIPERVRYDRRLTPGAKLLFAEIASFHHTGKECYAGYEYFANLYSVSEKTIQRYTHDLAQCGYIDITQNDKGQYIKRVKGTAFEPLRQAEINELWPETKSSGATGQNRPPQPDENVRQQYPSYNDQLQDTLSTDGHGLSSDTGFVNEEVSTALNEIILWLQGKKRVGFLSQEEWVNCMITLVKVGIPLIEFRNYYEWLDSQSWVTRGISAKLMIAQTENYLNREELAKKQANKEVKNGKPKKSTAASLLQDLRSRS